MQKITVKEVRGPLGKGEKKFFAVVDEKGAEFTTFDTKIKDVAVGSILDVELRVEGKYVNITEWKVIEEGQPSQAQRSPMTDRTRIYADFKIATLQVAGRLASAGKIDKGEITTVADEIYAWITSQPKVTTQKAPAEAKTTEEAWESMGHGERDPDTIKTLGDLFTACLADFNMQRTDVIKELGYSKQEEIGESPADCYRIISKIKAEQELPHPTPRSR